MNFIQALLATAVLIGGAGVSTTTAALLHPSAIRMATRYPMTVTDDTGARVTIKHLPRRIVSLAPGNTEMLFAAGCGPRVVGDTIFCDYPPAALGLAKVGDSRPNYEEIVALRPDLVVVDDIAQKSVAARLRSMGETVIALRPLNLPAIEADLRLIGTAAGSPAAAAATVARMDREIGAASAIAAKGIHPRVLAVIGHDPLYVAGRGTFMDDAIVRAGGLDAVAVRGYAEYSPESVIADAPDVILAGPDDQRALLANPAFRSVPAVRNHRFAAVDPGLLERPGPRITEGILQLAVAIHAKPVARAKTNL